ncbi:AAA family ATPase [Geminicoccus flavidas]|uniref:AAA family ATPase n=1 Tax=Geminicoccus flavidas TaxID=2506407 RepID=UPI001357FDFA|nr:AAA family ATPase [Geminicoccus flavidas]
MRLTRIVIHGFKSFADRVELTLEPGLTGIVGPNGCGKSNIVDALRWVSGEASARGVRGDDMDDVIFAGTGSRPARELADVMVVVEGDLTDYSRHATDGQAEVRRTITRGSGSTFRIAGREVRARDVQRLFQDAGAGARGTAIVAQGQVQAVTEAKPEDRRRFLEEAAGVGGLQSRKREAESKLLQTEGNLARIADLIGALQTRMEQLSRQAAQAERYRKVAKELREAEAELAAARLLDARQRFQAAATAARDADRLADQAEQARQAEITRLQTAETAAGTARDALARLVPRHAALIERVAARRSEADRAAVEAAELAARRDAALAERAQAEQRIEALAEERRSLAAEAEAAAAQSAQRTAEQPELEAAAAAASHHRTRLEADALTAREHRFEAEAKVARLRETLEGLVRADAGLQAAIETERARLDRLVPPETDPESLKLASQAANLAAELAAAEARQPAAAERLAAAEAALAGLRAERQAVAAALPALERRQGEIEEQHRRLQRRLAALAERRSALDRQRREHGDGVAKLGARPEAEVNSSAEAVTAARTALALAEQELAEARNALTAAEAEHAARLAAASAAASGLARLEQERQELAKVLPPVRADEVIAAIAVAEEQAAALAAALGEGLTASLDPQAPRHWVAGRAAPVESPAELAHLPRLADLARVPDALARALAPVWLAPPDEAARLQCCLPDGGALVSPDGGLWRWDGYVRLPGARDAAALLLAQRDRLERLTRQLDADRPVAAALRAEHQAAEAARQAARQAVAGREQALGRARQDLDAAERAARTALAADQAWQHRQVQLDELLGRIEAAASALQGDEAEMEAERAAAVDPREGQAELAQLRQRSTELTQAVAQAEREQALARQEGERLAAAIVRLREESASLAGRMRLAETAFQEQRAAILAERATAEAALARHGQEQADAASRRSVCQQELAAAEAELSHARAAAKDAEQALASAREAAAQAERRLAEAGTELRLLAERAAHRQERLGRLEAEAARLDAAIADAAQLATELAGRTARATAEAGRLKGEARALVQAEAEEAEAADAARTTAARAEAALAERREALAVAEQAERQAALAAAETRTARQAAQAALAALKEELAERFPDQALPEPEPGTLSGSLPELEERARRLRTSRDRMGAVNLLAAEEAEAARAEFERLSAERAELEEAAARLLKAVRSLDGEARQRLLDQFAVVERHFAELFTRLFNGGGARLTLTDPTDPLKGGLELEASPPGKRLTSLSLMSGGEKALTALCLIFAFFLAHPSPLCVLDEVDAPLDDANVGRLVDLVQEIAARTGTRFLVVTHHALTMARMDRLYGVTMIERGVSRLVSVELGRALEMRRTA